MTDKFKKKKKKSIIKTVLPISAQEYSVEPKAFEYGSNFLKSAGSKLSVYSCRYV